MWPSKRPNYSFKGNRNCSYFAPLISGIRYTEANAMRAIMLGIAIYASAPGVAAKCAAPTYLFSGQVTDSRGVPVQDAAVGVSWSVSGIPHGPDLGITDSNGRYSIQVEFPFSTGFSLFGDTCKQIVSAVSIAASSQTHYSIGTEARLTGRTDRVVRNLILDRPISSKVLWPVK